MNKKLIITIVSVVALVVLGVGVYGLSEARKKAKDPDASFVPISSEESSEEESSREKPVKPDQSRESSEESREESSIVKPEKEESSKPEKEEEEEPLPEGYVYSQYTGLPIPEEVALQTPVAVMLNNHIDAYPQSSISFADIVYEVPVEGSITRYLAVFQDYADLEKIGSIRSTRRYYLDFALDQSAVLVHFGDDESIQPIYNAI